MKKLTLVLLTAVIFSCNSGEEKKPESESNFPAVPNVNGNIPDTTNSINIDNNADSSAVADSLNK